MDEITIGFFTYVFSLSFLFLCSFSILFMVDWMDRSSFKWVLIEFPSCFFDHWEMCPFVLAFFKIKVGAYWWTALERLWPCSLVRNRRVRFSILRPRFPFIHHRPLPHWRTAFYRTESNFRSLFSFSFSFFLSFDFFQITSVGFW